MIKYDVIIIGSGPSGLMCAATLENKRVLVLEKNGEIGGKLKVSGGGRCNVTNNKDIDKFLLNVPKNSKFLYSTLTNFGAEDIIDFFESNHTPLKMEKDNRMFPQSDLSSDIITTFKRVLNDLDVTIKTNYQVIDVTQDQNSYIIDDTFITNNLVIATGGITYRHLGTDGFGHQLANEFDINVTNLYPVEAPLVSNNQLISSKVLQGVSLSNVKGTLYCGKKQLFSKSHDLLFTHFGLSGPLALQASYFAAKALREQVQPVTFVLDMNTEYISNNNVPKRILPYIVEDKITLEINDVRGSKHGFVTDGGVNLKEINPKTFESKQYPGLYFIGEVLDINAFTGGYNITICLSEGKSVGDYINQK